MRDGRYLPIKSLMKKMHVEPSDSPAPLRAVIAEAGVLVNAVVISRPHPDVDREVI